MKKVLIKLTLLSMLAFVMVSGTIAQRTITGIMTDGDTGEPLIGANVLVVGFDKGTITDIDGNYSIEVPSGATALEFSYTGYTSQTVQIGTDNIINVALSAGELLDEVVVTGYGSQSKKEVTSSVVKVTAEEFNKGPIADPAQLLQGKVAGLQVYNRGGDPNKSSTIRMRGISTVGANVEPLIVVDGIIGASLNNVDPNDIESIDVLKDGSAAAIYGSRGSSGVIIVTTKSGAKTELGFNLSYNGQFGASTPVRGIQIMDSDEFKAAGGTDLGSSTDWIEEVTQTGTNQVHNLSASGGSGNTTYRISGNIRRVDGVLRETGFDQYNTRMNFATKAFDDKLDIDFSTSFTSKDQQFGFNEALRYAILYNPTAPVLGQDSPFPFASDQYGGFFETLGLFDSFNPVSILSQNQNLGKRKEFNYGLNLQYQLTEAFSVRGRVAQQNTSSDNQAYYPTTSLFRGNATSPIRKGRADFYHDEGDFKLYELYGTYLADVGNGTLKLTGGYSYQQNNFRSNYLSLGDFPNNDINFLNKIETSQDLQAAGFITANSDSSPDEKIIAFFGRANLTLDDAIFVNASVRREGSTKLGSENQWGVFPAFGVGVDLNKYVGLKSLDQFKVRVGYGVTGALPRENGLAKPIREIVNGSDGSVSTELTRAANPDLKWEEKAELNFGIEFAAGKLSGSLDLYNRDIKDFILQRNVDAAVFGVNTRFENAGKINTKGAELALSYDVASSSDFRYTTGIVLSTYKTNLEEYVIEAETRGNLGAPGQNGTNMIIVRPGEEIGQIWGPVYTGVDAEGAPTFSDVNGDGVLVTDQDQALAENVDFAVLGNGIPDFELGWTNTMQIGAWNVNAFFRGAFGHSLVNTFRAFYEPQVSTQASYNFMNTKLKVDGLTNARFSSLYVEKADFFSLDNLTISRSIPLGNITAIRNMNVSLTGQNLFVITGYTGTSPEPSLVDSGSADNGGVANGSDVLSPGIDRRNNYFSSRTITLGINFNF
jgi:iron complex outermembrane receptor protein